MLRILLFGAGAWVALSVVVCLTVGRVLRHSEGAADVAPVHRPTVMRPIPVTVAAVAAPADVQSMRVDQLALRRSRRAGFAAGVSVAAAVAGVLSAGSVGVLPTFAESRASNRTTPTTVIVGAEPTTSTTVIQDRAPQPRVRSSESTGSSSVRAASVQTSSTVPGDAATAAAPNRRPDPPPSVVASPARAQEAPGRNGAAPGRASEGQRRHPGRGRR